MSKKIRLTKHTIKNKIKYNSENQFEVFKKSGCITICDGKEIAVDGCYGITEISEEKLKFSIGKKQVLISGGNFNIKEYSEKSMTVCGDVVSIEFCD